METCGDRDNGGKKLNSTSLVNLLVAKLIMPSFHPHLSPVASRVDDGSHAIDTTGPRWPWGQHTHTHC